MPANTKIGKKNSTKYRILDTVIAILAIALTLSLASGCSSNESDDTASILPGPSQVKELVREVTGVYALSVSPDGSKIVYVSFLDPANNKVSLVVRDARNGRAMNLLSSTGITSAVWGPDASTISYLTYTNDKQKESIGLMTDDVLEPQGIIDLLSYDIVSTPAWSPDGRSIAFWSRKYLDEKTSESTLWLVRPDGSNLKTLYGGAGSKTIGMITGDVSWSPDNSKLLFTMKNGDVVNAFTVESRGSSPKDLTSAQLKASDLFWSPNGKKIAYDAVDKADPNGAPKIWVMNADGSHQQALGPYGRPVGWVPNSGELVYIAEDKNAQWPTSKLGAIDVKTKAPRQLAEAENANIVAATVSRDSRVFYITADLNGKGQIMVVE